MKATSCQKCRNVMIQTDMFDKSKESIVGCKLMRQRDWDRGLKTDFPSGSQRQYLCPLAKLINAH